jgi:hypothetical protein
MNQVLAKYQIPHAIEQIILDALAGSTSHWKRVFQVVTKEITPHSTSYLAWQVKAKLNRLPKTTLRSVIKCIDADGCINYDLNWSNGCTPYRISINNNTIDVEGILEPYHYGLLMDNRYALSYYNEHWQRSEYDYLLTLNSIERFDEFIANELEATQIEYPWM